MNLSDKFWGFIAKKTARFRMVDNYNPLGLERMLFDAAAEEQAERTDSNVATVLRLITGAICWLPFKVVEVVDTAGGREFEDYDDHPIIELLENPNPYHSRSELMTHRIQSAVLAGNSFATIELKGGVPAEIYPVQTPRVSIKTDGRGFPRAYVIDANSPNETIVELNEMEHVRLYNVNDPFFGRSGVSPLRLQILMDYYADRHNLNFFKNNGVPGAMFTPKVPIQKEQASQIKDAWDKQNKGMEKAHGTFINPVPGDLHVYKSPLEDANFMQLYRMNREKVYSVFGIPPSVGGVYEYANYANAAIQERTYWENTIIPLLNIISEAVTRRLILPYYGKGFVLAFNLTNVKALQEDQLKKAQVDSIYVRSNILTINEVRNEMGREPVEWGDEPQSAAFGLSELLVQDDTKKKPNGSAPDDEDEDEGQDKTALILDGGFGNVNSLARFRIGKSPSNLKTGDARTKYWLAFSKRVGGFEIVFEKKMRKIFREQRNRVIENLEKYTGGGKVVSRLSNIYWAARRDALPEDLNLIFDNQLEDTILGEMAEDYLKKVFAESGDETFGRYRLEGMFDVNNPEVLAAIDARKNRIVGCNRVTFRMVQGILQEGYESGASIGELEKEIRGLFGRMSSGRAITIARTEMSSAYNGGEFAAFKQGEIPKKKWISTPDAYIRTYENGDEFDHKLADGESVETNAHFQQTGEPLLHPGDPAGSAGNVINCRCTFYADE